MTYNVHMMNKEEVNCMNRLLDWLEDLEDWMCDHAQALMTIGVPLVEVIIALIILKFIMR